MTAPIYESLPGYRAPSAFPGGAPASSGGKRGKKPCKYGPRGADGLCPKKPRSGRRASAAERTGDYRTSAEKRSDARNTRRAQRAVENIVVGTIKGAMTPAARRGIATLAGLPVGDVVRAGKAGAALLSTVALAGIAAYEITRYVLQRRAATKEQRAEQASQVAKAYRQARIDAAAAQRKPLTRAQLDEMARVFKDQLAQLGLSTSNLKGL